MRIDALGEQQRLRARPMRKPLALQALQLPVQVPGILLLGAVHPDHVPAAGLAAVIPKELA
jgi:hypothetical protein